MDGGVGSIEFDADGRVVNYKRVANRMRNNCGGGKTPWNTWVTCEEIDFGKIHQVDPTGSRSPSKTAMGNLGAMEVLLMMTVLMRNDRPFTLPATLTEVL
jgi:hypothetical protein